MDTISQISTLLLEKQAYLATAESCTGGLIGHLLTNVPGSSRWYVGGAIVYSNALKHGLLGVRQEVMERVGAVSAEVAEQLARGARQAFETEYAISATGIAGPDGGSEEKPVGLVYIGVATPEKVIVRRFEFEGSRLGNKESSADAAFSLLLELLQEEREQGGNRPPKGHVGTAVDATFGPDGLIRPLAFLWNGRSQKVSDLGRQWERDGVHHFLVMTPDNRVWELSFMPATLEWTVEAKSEARYLV
jgi:PncC family amidohydrolase